MNNHVGSELRVHAMALDDVESVLVMELRNYEYPWTPGIIRDCIVAGYECMKLVHKDELIGYYVLQIAANEAHLLNICIDKPQQEKAMHYSYCDTPCVPRATSRQRNYFSKSGHRIGGR